MNDMNLSGFIPSEIGNLLNLTFLDLSTNEAIIGNLPSQLFDLPNIEVIYLSNCTLTGTIPSTYGNPPLLRDLYLNGNFFAGAIPEIASGQLENLEEFLVYENAFTGSMPASICALRDNSTTPFLEDLWADCAGETPLIQCDFPACCNRCFP
jgi:hypothetical protein